MVHGYGIPVILLTCSVEADGRMSDRDLARCSSAGLSADPARIPRMPHDAPDPLRLEPSPRKGPKRPRPPRDSFATTKFWFAGDAVGLAASVRLLDRVLGVYGPRLLKVRPRSGVQAVLAGLATTAIRRAKVVHQLLASAETAWRCNQEAAILTRTILDLAISALYIASAPGVQRDQLAARFLAFEGHQIDKLMGRKGRAPRGSPRERAGLAFKDLDELAYRGWSGLTNAKMIKKIQDKAAREVARALQEEFSFLSSFVHPSPAGTRRSVGGLSIADQLLDAFVAFYAALALEAVSNALLRFVRPPLSREDDRDLDELAEAFDEYAAAIPGLSR